MRKATIVLLTLLWASSSWSHGPQLRGPFLTPGSVTEERLADLSVAEAKLQPGSITSDKISAGAIQTAKLADISVTTVKLADAAVTSVKLSQQPESLARVSGGVMTSDGTNIGINETAPNAKLEVKASIADQFTLQISSQDGSAVMVVDKVGFVGIGTDSPVTNLEVFGDRIDMSSNNNATIRIKSDENNNGGNTDSILQFFIDGGTQKGDLRFDQGTDTFSMSYGVFSNYHFNIDSSGNIGINETAPAARLEVKADVADDFVLQVSSQNGTAIIQIDRLGHTIATGADPVITSCGTTPSVSGSDRAGNVTIGTEVTTSCTVTFAEPYASTPSCTVTGDNTAVTYARTITASVLTILSSADMASDVISYNCMGL